MTARTAFLVRVTDPAEADAALTGGADRLGISDARGVLPIDTVAAIVRAVSGRCTISAPPHVLGHAQDPAAAAGTLADAGVDLVEFADAPDSIGAFTALRARRPRSAAAVRVRATDAANPALRRYADAGFGVALLQATAPARLTGQLGIDALASFVGAARGGGLAAWVEGALEPPDVPRFLALGPDALAFRTVVCRDGVRTNGLDPARVAMMRQLIPQGERSVTPAPVGTADRVFVHDFIVEGEVGAYRSEHKAPQRMRFNVDAELAPFPPDVADMRDVFSYDIIIDAIRLATRRHVLLVERIALDVADATLRDPRVRTVRVRVEKLDVLPGSVGVEIERTRA